VRAASQATKATAFLTGSADDGGEGEGE